MGKNLLCDCFYNYSLSNSNLTFLSFGRDLPAKPIPDYKITFLTESQRVGFFLGYLLTFTIAVITNIATIIVTIKKKMRSLQKTWTVSLALSDIIVAIFLGANNMVMLSHPMNNWILGSFMCRFVPYMQNTGQIANSITMSLIAFDRYRNIVHSLNNQWDPKNWACGIIFCVVWIIPALIMIPQWFITKLVGPTSAILTDPKNSSIATGTEQIYFCKYGDPKERNLIFYTLIGCATFLPLMCIFLYLYFKIAQLIWRKRRPPSEKYSNNNSINTIETSTGETKISIQTTKKSKIISKSGKTHVERKIRTFKIILVIMFVFFLSRMPHWIFNVIRFSMVSADKSQHWITSYTLSFFVVLNTAINPFLYSFLTQTMNYIDKCFTTVGDFVSKICCCFCDDFENYEKENFTEHVCEQRSSQSSNIIPRGPYYDNKGKLENAPQTHTYPRQKESMFNYVEL